LKLFTVFFTDAMQHSPYTIATGQFDRLSMDKFSANDFDPRNDFTDSSPFCRTHHALDVFNGGHGYSKCTTDAPPF